MWMHSVEVYVWIYVHVWLKTQRWNWESVLITFHSIVFNTSITTCTHTLDLFILDFCLCSKDTWGHQHIGGNIFWILISGLHYLFGSVDFDALVSEKTICRRNLVQVNCSSQDVQEAESRWGSVDGKTRDPAKAYHMQTPLQRTVPSPSWVMYHCISTRFSKFIPFWIHQWVNLLMRSEPLWSEYLPYWEHCCAVD